MTVRRLDIHRHSGESRHPRASHNTVIPAIYPSLRRFTRHSGESRNLAPPPYSAFRRSNGQPAKPPEKSAIFNDTTHLPTVHQCGTLAPASPATRPQGSDVPPKANPRRPSTRRPQPTGRRLKSKGKGIGRIIGQSPRNRVQDNTAKTVGIATIVGSGTHSALFHGGVSGHAAGVPTALCRSSNGPGHGKLGHEICKQNSPGRSSDSLNPTAQPPMPSPPLNNLPTATNKRTSPHENP